MDAHTPYNPPKSYTDCDVPVDVVAADAFSDSVNNADEIRQAYFDSCSYLSTIYKDIFNELSKQFDYIVTLSDHGEMLGEYGMWNHSYGLYPELTHIPLVISGDEIENEKISDAVNILDVHQTVCDLSGAEVKSRGRNILESFDRKELLTEYKGLLSWHREQFARAGISEETFEEHNPSLDGIVTESGEYGYETHREGIKTTEKLSIEDAKEKIKTLKTQLDQKDVQDVQESEVSDNVKKQLKDLGYA